ncbi:MAG: hypothetical protein QG671_1505 [Actinomycetota bacterium]|nr:hypothetical protein [Actinomycetota bacterium]
MASSESPDPAPKPIDFGPMFTKMQTHFGHSFELGSADWPSQGSSLAGDDQRSAPFRLSHAALLSYSTGADHLEAIRFMIQDGKRTQPWASHTLVRGALENFATAVWLIAPKKRNERLTRRFQLAMYDVKNSNKVQRIGSEVSPPDTSNSDQPQKQIEELADALGISHATINRWPGHGKIVSQAALDAGFEPIDFELVWSLCSGMAHGMDWATRGTLRHDVLHEDTSGKVISEVTTDPKQLMAYTAPALIMADKTVDLFKGRGMRHY